MESDFSTPNSTQLLLSIVYNDPKKTISPKFINEIFSKAIRKFESLSDFYFELKKLQLINDPLIKAVRTFAFHYLSRSSPLPMPLEASWERGQRSPFDYISAWDKATYYRGDGSALHQEVLARYLPDGSQHLNLSCEYRIGLVKPKKFSSFMKKACGVNWYRYESISDMNNVNNEENTDYKTKGIFFDITNWIGTIDHSSMELEMLLQTIQQAANTLLDTDVIGGVFQPDEEKPGIYIFFTKNAKNLEEENTSLNLEEENASFTRELVASFLNMLGLIGGYPEIIEMKSALEEVKQLDPLQKFGRNTSSIPKFGTEAELIKAVIKSLENISGGKGSLQLYVRIIKKIFTAVTTNEQKKYNTLDYPDKLILYSMTSLQEELVGFNTSSEFYNQLQHIYLAIEEIIFLSKFFQPKDFSLNMKNALLPLFDKKLRKELSLCNNQHFLFSLDSGMACFAAIIESVFQCYRKKDENSLSKPILGIVNGTYYEMSEEYSKFLEEEWEVKLIDPNNNNQEAIDLLLLDLYPNDVNLEEMLANPVEKIIASIVKKRTQANPLTVAIDVSTSLFSDSQILKLRNYFEAAITAGALNLIIHSSLAKFYGCGLDKYTGGVIAVLGGQAESTFKNELLTELASQQSESMMSYEAERFYSLLFQYVPDEIKSFYEIIKQNNNTAYNQIKNIGTNNIFSIRKKDDRVPMISLYDESESAKDMEKNLYRHAQEAKLPLLVRSSFPFPHSSIVECGKSLRLIVGLEYTDFQKNYLKLFSDYVKKVGKDEKENVLLEKEKKTEEN